jgi:hypothetical protein
MLFGGKESVHGEDRKQHTCILCPEISLRMLKYVEHFVISGLDMAYETGKVGAGKY